MRWDCYEISDQTPDPTIEDVEYIVDVMNDIVLGNRSQPMAASVLLELRQAGHRVIVNGAEGISNENMEVLPELHASFIWPEIKWALLASIDKDPSQWSAHTTA